MTDREAMKMALDTMLSEYSTGGENKYSPWDVIEALRQALAQPEIPMSPEHLPQYIATNNIKPTIEGGGGGGGGGAQPEQEPVAWKKSYDIVCALLRQAHDILATTQYPIKREWVGLTDAEVASFENAGVWGEKDIRAIEAKLKEKNGG